MRKAAIGLAIFSLIGILFLAGCKTTTTTQQQQTVIRCGDGICHLPEFQAGTCMTDCGVQQQQPATTSTGMVYVDLYGNLMDKAKFATNPSNAYAGIASQAVKFFDITKNPSNDPRTNPLAVPDFQIVADSTTNGYLSGTKKGVAGHTYAYLFENNSGHFYDVSGSFTIPANTNPHAPAFDMGNILAPMVGTFYTYNESGDRTDNTDTVTGHRSMDQGLNSTTLTTDYRIQVGSLTYGEFVRIWGEYTSTATKAEIVGVSAVQKSGPTMGISIDASDEKNPIITISELNAQYPVTFTYYVQGSASVTSDGNYTIYADDWNAVPGKFATKIDSVIILDV